jgi:RNA polymerase sigma-70 factor (ECF subfamily)
VSKDPEFDELMTLLRAGDEDAAARMFRRYARRVVGLARARLDYRLRSKLDPDDVVQSVFRSFFRRLAGGDWKVPDWDGVWALLVVMTVRKCGRKAQHFRAARRHVGRETATLTHATATGPGPVESAALADTLARLAARLDDRDRIVLDHVLDGYTPAETAGKIGRGEQTVRRALDRIRRQLEILRAAE